MLQSSGVDTVFVPFPGEGGRVPPATRFRSTWLTSSLRSIRQRGLLDEYLRHLPKEHHAAVLDCVAGVWHSVDVAIAHYSACDALNLTTVEQVAIGEEVTLRAQGTVLGTILKLATRAGVTPWFLLAQSNRMWSNTWIGGGVAVYRQGPSRARIEIASFPCSRFTYCRNAMRGLIQGSARLFAERAYAQDISSLCTAHTLGYSLQWS